MWGSGGPGQISDPDLKVGGTDIPPVTTTPNAYSGAEGWTGLDDWRQEQGPSPSQDFVTGFWGHLGRWLWMSLGGVEVGL